MKRTLIIIAVLLVLITLWALFIRPMGGSSGEMQALEFAFKDTTSISKIELKRVNKEVEKGFLTLTRQGPGSWMVNGEYAVLNPRIKSLLITIGALQREQTLSSKGKARYLELIKRNHTEVKIYTQEGLVRHYYIGPVNKDHTGNVMLLKGEDEPFIMSRAGMIGYVSVHYSPNLVSWRENRLWNLKSADLAYISITRKEGGEVSLEKVQDDWVAGFEGADPMKIETFLSWFRGNVNAETWAGEKFPGMKSRLLEKEPDLIFEYRTNSNVEDKILLFSREDNHDAYFGWKESEGELLTIQHFVIDKYLPTVDYFLAEPL